MERLFCVSIFMMKGLKVVQELVEMARFRWCLGELNLFLKKVCYVFSVSVLVDFKCRDFVALLKLQAGTFSLVCKVDLLAQVAVQSWFKIGFSLLQFSFGFNFVRAGLKAAARLYDWDLYSARCTCGFDSVRTGFLDV